MPPAVKDAIVEQVRNRLSTESYPRLTIMAALIVSGGAGALFSAVSLYAGLLSMPVRYFLAVCAGYAAFLGCIRVWIAYERRVFTPERAAASFRPTPTRGGLSLTDVVPDVDISPGRPAARAAANMFAGGQSGGGGGGAQWAAIGPVQPDVPAPASGLGDTAGGALGHIADGLDSDDLFWLLVAAVAAFGGLLAVCWVVYLAPVLLAEVALNAAVVSTAYRRLQAKDLDSWATAVLRRTGLPAGVLAAMMTIMGWALQHLAPQAHSIGGVVRKLLS